MPGRCGCAQIGLRGVRGMSGDELWVPGRCDQGAAGCGCLPGLFPEPGTPPPTLRFVPFSLQSLARAPGRGRRGAPGWAASPRPGGGSRTPAPHLPQLPRLHRRGRPRPSTAGVRRGQHPLATLPSSWKIPTEAVPWPRRPRGPGCTPSPGQAGGMQARPGRSARWKGSGARRAPSCAASPREVLPGALPAPALAGEWQRIPEPRPRRPGALLLFFLTPPSSHPCAPGNLGTVGEVGAARAARWPGLCGRKGRRRRSWRERRGERGAAPGEPLFPGPLCGPLFRALPLGPPVPEDSLGAAQVSTLSWRGWWVEAAWRTSLASQCRSPRAVTASPLPRPLPGRPSGCRGSPSSLPGEDLPAAAWGKGARGRSP